MVGTSYALRNNRTFAWNNACAAMTHRDPQQSSQTQAASLAKLFPEGSLEKLAAVAQAFVRF